MKAPLSWLKDFVDIDLSIPDLARLLTMAGMEVEELRIIGLPMPTPGSVDAHFSGLEWDREKIVVASILEVMPHPNADRLTLCKLFDGQQEHIVLTGAPNLFEFKGIGPLPKALKVAYAKEGAQIYDGHQEGLVLTKLKRATIRGVESYSMVCSEKELGISDDHEGILFLDDDAPVGMPLADYLSDAVLDVKLLPSYARCASILGLAREIAAMTGKPLKTSHVTRHTPALSKVEGAKDGVGEFAEIEITNPEMNPRFVLGLIKEIEIRPSPGKVQRRLKMAGMRPINNIVDATNYAMLEIGEPLHAFDYDVLVKRAKGKQVKIITRTAKPGEKLTTLDGVERKLDATTVLVCDEAGALSMAGVMGGLESEVYDATQEVLDARGIEPQVGETPKGKASARGKSTTSILLEGAAWNFINIRKTARTHALHSEASYRFARGVHPAMAERGVRRGLELMQAWANGKVAPGLVDAYPLPFKDPTIEITPADVKRWLGVEVSIKQMKSMLERLEFKCTLKAKKSLLVTVPDHRIDIGEGVTGKADIVEEIARIYGYENIPETRIADELPPQLGNPALDKEERVRDLLVAQGLQEIVSYRFTTPARESRRLRPDTPPDDKPYVRITNPIAPDKAVLRHSVLASVLDIAERNARVRERLALFEIGPVFLASEEPGLPEELQCIAILLAGARTLSGWQPADTGPMDFFDLKGVLTTLLDDLRISEVRFESAEHPSFHPGKCAKVMSGERQIGVFGELHPQVRGQYDWPASFRTPVLAADLDLENLLTLIPPLYQTEAVPTLPPVLEDLAIVVDENVPAERVAELIRQTGGKVVTEVRLFDVYRDEKIGTGKKSLAYNLTYQAANKTFSDKEVAGMRTRILRRLEQELGAVLRS
ncbi:MAG: phenylalanine--tRNA ligase subunit beta [Chloroflexi bacterium]|nr:phenylalanine--tRNA ligase subunit beta [Chloroflexota bacterium]